MNENPPKRKTNFWGSPFDLNKNGKIDPTEAALIMSVLDDIDEKEKMHVNVKKRIIDIDDLDIKGI